MPGSRLRWPNLNKRPSKPILSCSRHGSAFSRRDASEVLSFSLRKKGGRRKRRVPAAPAASRAMKKAHECIHHRFAEQSGVSCAMVLRLIPCSPRRTGLSCHRRPRKNSRELDTSVGVPGPHGFAVRRGICGRWIRNSPRLDQLERIHAQVPQGELVRFGPTGY
jgi:hypothetical protein